jgi:hypothetical protein
VKNKTFVINDCAKEIDWKDFCIERLLLDRARENTFGPFGIEIKNQALWELIDRLRADVKRLRCSHSFSIGSARTAFLRRSQLSLPSENEFSATNLDMNLTSRGHKEIERDHPNTFDSFHDG